MSRIGKKPVIIPQGVTLTLNGDVLTVKGSKGELKMTILPVVAVKISENQVNVECLSEEKFARSMYGTTRAIIDNMVVGVSQGFTRSLEINGVGYKANMKGKSIELSLGFSHPVLYTPKESVDIVIDEKKKNLIHISGINKQEVGEVAAQIRAFKKPEPYKGKGIKYLEETIIRKAGKSSAK